MVRNFSELEIRKLSVSFRSAKPFRHVLIRDFLAHPINVRKGLEGQRFSRKDSDLFSFWQTQNLLFKTHKELKGIVDIFSSSYFSKLISKITSEKLSPGAVDLSGALYEDTDYLLCHDDDLEGRKVAYILYLSEDFSKKDGGALSFYDSNKNHPGKKIVSYPPLMNSLMVFKVSEGSWHEVEEVTSGKKRYTIGGWLH